jgi:SAM-dependent methyltransferase
MHDSPAGDVRSISQWSAIGWKRTRSLEPPPQSHILREIAYDISSQRLVNGLKSLGKAVIPEQFQPRLRRSWEKLSCWGYGYTCPLCGSHLRRFLPSGATFSVLESNQVVGGGHRSNVRCPFCCSSDRERLLYLFLRSRTDIFEPRESRIRVLHVAPESQLTCHLAAEPGLDYLTADLNPDGVMVKMDVTRIQFPDADFDVIICNHVLEHVLDDRVAMSELYRVLAPGGWAVLQVPISLTLDRTYEDSSVTSADGRQLHFGQADHVRIYARDYRDRLERVGFTVKEFSWIAAPEEFGTSENRFGLNERETIYLGEKPLGAES